MAEAISKSRSMCFPVLCGDAMTQQNSKAAGGDNAEYYITFDPRNLLLAQSCYSRCLSLRGYQGRLFFCTQPTAASSPQCRAAAGSESIRAWFALMQRPLGAHPIARADEQSLAAPRRQGGRVVKYSTTVHLVRTYNRKIKLAN
jgi:hypothetical protein